MRTTITALPSARRLAGTCIGLAFFSVGLVAVTPNALASQALAQKSGCVACHQVDKKLVGPAWQDIAAKYSGSVTAEQLASSIKKGGSGKWGPIPMPPQPQVSDADLSVLSTWILQGGKP